MSDTDDIKAYVKERDAIVGNPSISIPEFMAWSKKQGCNFSNEISAEIALHKLRTASANLPMEMRLASDKWLKERDYESWM